MLPTTSPGKGVFCLKRKESLKLQRLSKAANTTAAVDHLNVRSGSECSFSRWLSRNHTTCFSINCHCLPISSPNFFSIVLQRNWSSTPSSRTNIQPHLWLGLARRCPRVEARFPQSRHQRHDNGLLPFSQLQAPRLPSSQCQWQGEPSALHPRWGLGPRIYRSGGRYCSYNCQV